MSYFKYQTPEALAAWDKLQSDQKQMRDEGAQFAALFGGRPVYSNDISRSRFHGVKFDDAFYIAKELWTKPTSSTGFASWPKARAPKGLIEEYKALTELWKANHPSVSVDIDEFYKAVGFDWGMLLICGFTYFAFDGAVYVYTKAKPQDGFGAVEIVGSEFDKAKAGYLDAQA